MRFHTRGILSDGRPVILKVNAADVYEAATLARRELVDNNIDPATVTLLKVRPMGETKSAVYIGKARDKAKDAKRGAHFRKSAVDPAVVEAANEALDETPRKSKKGKR